MCNTISRKQKTYREPCCFFCSLDVPGSSQNIKDSLNSFLVAMVTIAGLLLLLPLLAAQLVLPELCHFHCLGDAYCSQLISQEGFGNNPVTKSVTHPEVD